MVQKFAEYSSHRYFAIQPMIQLHHSVSSLSARSWSSPFAQPLPVRLLPGRCRNAVVSDHDSYKRTSSGGCKIRRWRKMVFENDKAGLSETGAKREVPGINELQVVRITIQSVAIAEQFWLLQQAWTAVADWSVTWRIFQNNLLIVSTHVCVWMFPLPNRWLLKF